MIEVSVRQQLMGIHDRLSSLVADPRLQKVYIREPAGPGDPDSGQCRLKGIINSPEDLVAAVNKIFRWIGYIIEVTEEHQ